LGVVVSECASANLDITRPWITVIPNDKLDDLEYVVARIAENKNAALSSREDIRKYGLSKFGWSGILAEYISSL